MPRQNAESTTLKTRSKDIDDGFAGREHPFAEQEQRIKSVPPRFCAQFPSTGSRSGIHRSPSNLVS